MDAQQATMEVFVDVQDIYSWRAGYSSLVNKGTAISLEYLDEAHAVGGFASVDLERCTHLALIDQAGKAAHVVEIPGGAKPVFFRRRRISVNVMEESRAASDSALHWLEA